MNRAEAQERAAEAADSLCGERHIRIVADPEITLRAQGIDLCRQPPQSCVAFQDFGLPALVGGGDDRRLPVACPELVIAHWKGREIESATGFGDPAFVS